MDYQPIKKRVMIRVYPTVLTEPTNANTIHGTRKVFNHLEETYTFADVVFKDNKYFEPRSIKSYKRLIDKETLEQLYQIEDDVYAGFLDYGDMGAVVTTDSDDEWAKTLEPGEVVILRKGDRERPMIVTQAQFDKKYVW